MRSVTGRGDVPGYTGIVLLNVTTGCVRVMSPRRLHRDVKHIFTTGNRGVIRVGRGTFSVNLGTMGG